MKKLSLIQSIFISTLIVDCGNSNQNNTNKEDITSIESKEEISSSEKETVKIDYPLDYSIKTSNNKVKVLQITDPQVFMTNEDELYSRAYKYMDYVVEQTNPDLIIVTGDIIYGRYDNDGTIFTSIVNRMESYNTPWAPVFGNHDNESPVGTDYQVNKLLTAKNCLFKRRSELSGNGNYSVGLFINDDLVRSLYMIDTKGCTQIDGDTKKSAAYGISQEQIDYITDCQAKCEQYQGKVVKGFVAMHVMPSLMTSAVYIKYGVKVNDLSKIKSFAIPENNDGDFGSFNENSVLVVDKNGDAFYSFLDCNIDGIFAGHEHQNNASVIFDGIRMTYGLKSSTCDFYDASKLGGTLIEVSEDSFDVTHIYYSYN